MQQQPPGTSRKNASHNKNTRTKAESKTSSADRSCRKISADSTPEKDRPRHLSFQFEVIDKYDKEIENIQKTIMKELNELREENAELIKLTTENEAVVLSAYKILGQVTLQINDVSKILGEDAGLAYLYSPHRQISESITKLSEKLQNYRSNSQGFSSVRQQFLMPSTAEQLSSSQHAESEHPSTDSLEVRIQNLNQPEQQTDYYNQVNRLKQQLRSDNEEFVNEIRKYNSALYQLQEDIEKLERDRELLDIRCQELRNQNHRMKEGKLRDELVIKNLTKKLMDRGGSGGYSPRQHPQQNYDRTSVSPARVYVTDKQGARRVYDDRTCRYFM